MKIILDTNSFLWFITDDSKLSTPAYKLIEDIENTRLLSVASLWEIAIKMSIGKLELTSNYEDFFSIQLKQNYIDIFSITLSHLAKVRDLPFHHKDPFDRLIIAQSLTENIPVVSNDKQFDKYGIQRLW